MRKKAFMICFIVLLMLNNFVLVGRITDIYDGIVVINVTRSYKNEFGEYVNDKIELEVGEHIFTNVKE